MGRAAFTHVLAKRVSSFSCDRASPVDLRLDARFKAAHKEGAVVVTVPTAVPLFSFAFSEVCAARLVVFGL